MYPSIGKKIRKYRKERGMTQEELAEKLDLSINYVVPWNEQKRI